VGRAARCQHGLVLFRTASHRTGRARFRSIRLSSELLHERTRQATPAALTQDTQNRFGALHYAYLPDLMCHPRLAPFALRAAFPPSLAGRDCGDYYGASVTIGARARQVIPRSSLSYVVSVT
jgi:hypothetical protein